MTTTCIINTRGVIQRWISENGGAEEDRTPDPLRARQVLSQLSYSPKFAVSFRATIRYFTSLSSVMY